jgi:hypothetical protein
MAKSIRVGTMLIADGTRTPELVILGTQSYSTGWSSILDSTSAQLDKGLEDVGWTFFYMAGEIRTRGFGSNDQSRMNRAIAHVIDAVKRDGCNCLEITQVIRGRSFLGLPYTNVVAHARHIQKSRSFHDLSTLPARIGFRQQQTPLDQRAPAQSQMSFSSKAVDIWEDEGGSRAVPVSSAP